MSRSIGPVRTSGCNWRTVRYPEWFLGTDDDIDDVQHASIGTSIMGRLSAAVVVVCNAARADRTRE
jgi:hypothetical protein